MAEDHEETWRMIAALALPRAGSWSITDLVAADGSIHRLPVVHPDAEKQDLARQLGSSWPPERDDPLGLPAVLRTRATQVAGLVSEEFLTGMAHDAEHLEILRQLGITGVITVPLLARERVLGAMTFVCGSPCDGYTHEEHALAENLASRCALAIEQMHQVEELKKSVLLRDQVLGYVSHDLKNPLGTILLSASHILNVARAPHANVPAEHWIRMANSILKATVHMQRLIGDLLEVAQIGTGGVTIERQPIEPSILVDEVRDAYGAGLVAQSVQLETEVPEGLPILLADPGRLRQVFENLLENAAKFTSAGGAVTIGAAQLDGSVLFSVADTGGGIPQQEMPLLFDRFWQARRLSGSAGLGLTICKGIVEAHGGSIWARSVVGCGSTFYFSIPIVKQPGSPGTGSG